MMFRPLAATSAALALAALAGCATQQQAAIERDPVDTMIAKSAADATAALRDLAESAGNARVVTSAGKGPAAAKSQAAAAAPAPAPAPAPRPQGQSIGARAGSLAVDTPGAAPAAVTQAAAVAVASTVISSPSSGVVASGGLLSAPPAGLERLITVRWTGELEELLRLVAKETGWTLSASTGLRVAPVIISLNAESRSAFDVVRDIGAIAGTSADIAVHAQARTFTVRYPSR